MRGIPTITTAVSTITAAAPSRSAALSNGAGKEAGPARRGSSGLSTAPGWPKQADEPSVAGHDHQEQPKDDQEANSVAGRFGTRW